MPNINEGRGLACLASTEGWLGTPTVVRGHSHRLTTVTAFFVQTPTLRRATLRGWRLSDSASLFLGMRRHRHIRDLGKITRQFPVQTGAPAYARRVWLRLHQRSTTAFGTPPCALETFSRPFHGCHSYRPMHDCSIPIIADKSAT